MTDIDIATWLIIISTLLLIFINANKILYIIGLYLYDIIAILITIVVFSIVYIAIK